MLPRRVNCLKLISNNEDLGFYAFPLRNLNWNTDSLRYYAEKQAITWPTCTQASTARSTFALMWARMNRCSCIYDIRGFPKLSQIEKQTLSWLEKEVRPKLHREAKFHGKVDTPIALLDGPGLPRYANDNCLWNAFVTRQDRILPTPITMFAIDEYVLETSLYKPAEFDSYDIPNQRQNDLLRLHDQFVPEIASSQSNDSKWDCEKRLREMGTDPLTNKKEGICFAKVPSYSSFNVRIALTIFGQGMRLLNLQNEQQYTLLLSQFNLMAMQLFNSRDSSSQVIMNRFVNEECKIGDGSITSILQRSSKPLGFGSAFVQRYAFSTQSNDTTESLASRLIETLIFDEKAGLYVFDVTANGTNKAVVPILLRKEDKHFQCVAAVYRSSKGGDKVWMRLVTRSLEGVCDYGYYMCQCYNVQDKGKPATFKCTTPSKIATLTPIFPCVLNGAYDQLQCLVFIPTTVQTTVSGSNHSLGLNDSIEIISNGWTVKDYQSFQLHSHLTKRSLATMVEYAVSNFDLGATGGQNFFVSDTLIEELLSLDTFLQEEPNSSVSVNDRIPKSLVELAHKCIVYRAGSKTEGIAHLLLGYKDVNKETIWLYAYYYQYGGHHVLVFCPCSSDPTRDVMMAASVIKKYLEAINKSKIVVWKLQWKQVSTSNSNSGFHVFKEFLYHAQVMHKKGPGNEREEDYLSMFRRALENDSESFPWILTNLTKNQMEQIQTTWQTELFTATRQSMHKLFELMTYK